MAGFRGLLLVPGFQSAEASETGCGAFVEAALELRETDLPSMAGVFEKLVQFCVCYFHGLLVFPNTASFQARLSRLVRYSAFWQSLSTGDHAQAASADRLRFDNPLAVNHGIVNQSPICGSFSRQFAHERIASRHELLNRCRRGQEMPFQPR